MIGDIVEFEDLQRLSGLTDASAIKVWAMSVGISYLADGRGGIWTTICALNSALGVSPSRQLPPYPPDLV